MKISRQRGHERLPPGHPRNSATSRPGGDRGHGAGWRQHRLQCHARTVSSRASTHPSASGRPPHAWRAAGRTSCRSLERKCDFVLLRGGTPRSATVGAIQTRTRLFRPGAGASALPVMDFGQCPSATHLVFTHPVLLSPGGRLGSLCSRREAGIGIPVSRRFPVAELGTIQERTPLVLPEGTWSHGSAIPAGERPRAERSWPLRMAPAFKTGIVVLDSTSEDLAAGVYIEEIPGQMHPIQGVSTWRRKTSRSSAVQTRIAFRMQRPCSPRTVSSGEIASASCSLRSR